MGAYSLDVRTRGLKDSDAGMASKLVAETYAVSRAWVDRLKPRRRETGEIAPRRQTRWRTPRLHAPWPRLAILIREHPDRTLVEWPQALPTSASLQTIWRAVTQRGCRLKKNGGTRPTTPVRTWQRPGQCGSRPPRPGIARGSCFWMNVAGGPTWFAATGVGNGASAWSTTPQTSAGTRRPCSPPYA